MSALDILRPTRQHRLPFIPADPIAQREYRHLRQRHRAFSPKMRWLRFLLVALALCITSLPFGHYIDLRGQTVTNTPAEIIALLLITYGLQAFVLWRTLYLASDVIPREKTSGSWENLLLTTVDARQIIWGKWRGVLRYTWRWHLLAAWMRLTLAYAVTQYLRTIPWAQDCLGPFSGPYCYGSLTEPAYPTGLRFGIALAAILTYALLEAGLIAGLGILASMLMKRSKFDRLAIASLLRGLLLVLPVALMLIVAQHNPLFAEYQPQNIYDMRLVQEAGLVAIFPFADGGTLLAANILRPDSTTLFLLRTLASAATGIAIYALIIWGALRIAQGRLVQAGALPAERAFGSAAGLLAKLNLPGNPGTDWLRWGRYWVYIPALIAVVLPFAGSYDATRIEYLLVISAFVVAAQGIALVRVFSATARTNRIYQATTSHGTARQRTYSGWLAAIQATMQDHMILGVLRLGLAYGWMLYFGVVPFRECLTALPAFCYVDPYYSGSYMALPVNVLFPKLIFAAAALALVGLAEAGLIAALSQCTLRISSQRRWLALPLTLALRIGIVLVAALLLAESADINHQLYRQHMVNSYFPAYHDWLRVLELGQVSLSPLADGGVLLGANVIRPAGTNMFVLRQVTSALLAAGLFGLTSLSMLWIAGWQRHKPADKHLAQNLPRRLKTAQRPSAVLQQPTREQANV